MAKLTLLLALIALQLQLAYNQEDKWVFRFIDFLLDLNLKFEGIVEKIFKLVEKVFKIELDPSDEGDNAGADLEPPSRLSQCLAPVFALIQSFQHVIRNLMTCIRAVVDEPLTLMRVLLEEIRFVIEEIMMLPSDLNKCGYFNVVCHSDYLLRLATIFGTSITTISKKLAETVSFMSSLPYSLVPCTVIKTDMKHIIMNTITNSTNCITGTI